MNKKKINAWFILGLIGTILFVFILICYIGGTIRIAINGPDTYRAFSFLPLPDQSAYPTIEAYKQAVLTKQIVENIIVLSILFTLHLPFVIIFILESIKIRRLHK